MNSNIFNLYATSTGGADLAGGGKNPPGASPYPGSQSAECFLFASGSSSSVVLLKNAFTAACPIFLDLSSPFSEKHPKKAPCITFSVIQRTFLLTK